MLSQEQSRCEQLNAIGGTEYINSTLDSMQQLFLKSFFSLIHFRLSIYQHF